MSKKGYTELTLDLLSKSPEAGMLLVQLHDKHKLYAMAKDRHPDARSELASLMAELLDLEIGVPEIELVTDVLVSLLNQAEIDLKQAVAERLSVMDDVPLRLAVKLANEDICVAESILRKSNALDDMDLIYIVKSQSEDHWRAIAKRARISGGLINALADTKDLNTAISLTENKNICLTSHAMGVFSNLAKKSENLAKPLLLRDELPEHIATKLYSFVSEELKTHIRSTYDVADIDFVNTAVDTIVTELKNSAEGEYTPNIGMITAAENMLEKGFLNAGMMIDNLRRGQISNFVALFSVYCGLPVHVVEEMLQQKSAQGLAVACKAVGIQKTEFVNVFLLTSRVRGGKVIDQNELSIALRYYDKITEVMAKKILNQSRH